MITKEFRLLQKQPPRQFSKISVLFFQEQPFYNFPGGSICSSNRHEFSRRVHLFVEQKWIFQEGLYVLWTDTNFLGGLIEKTCFFQESPSVRRTEMNFPGGSICSLNRHEFSRRAYRKDMFFKEVLSVRRTDLIISSSRY